MRESLEANFTARATELGSIVLSVSGIEEAADLVASLARDAGAPAVVLSESLASHGDLIAEKVRKAGCALIDSAAPRPVASAYLGVGVAALGVAETGSVLLVEDGLQPKLAATLPVASVLLLRRADLVAGLDEAGRLLRDWVVGTGRRAPYATFVSGPSRTSDVEKTLTIGVHGPGRQYVILIG